jgi:hypothetical protein
MAKADVQHRFKQLANEQLRGKSSTIRSAAIQRLIYYANAGVPISKLVAML